jgi:hypothetical protein
MALVYLPRLAERILVVQRNPSGPVMSGKVWAMLLALALLWGGSFFFTGAAERELP